MNIKEIINKVLSTQNASFFYTPPIYGKSKSYLFLKPQKKVIINSLNQLDKKLNQIDEFIKKGFIGYSLLNYEAGYLFEKTLRKYLSGKDDLLQFYFYDKSNVIELHSNTIDLNSNEKYKIKKFRLNTSKAEYEKSIKKIKNYIAEGDTYQVNFTVKANFTFSGELTALISNLIFNQSARYISIINNNPDLIISLSPELFFEIKGNQITSKPMKGTIRRGLNLDDDKLNYEKLKQSEKNKAENVMIVDMIRNDLGKISKYGSVKVKNLFEIEKYESVYQMVSTVDSTLNKNIKLSDVLRNIFPCASITGAPKIRTMEIINELEKEKRGIYTGSIGLITNNKIAFSVAIRTLNLNVRNKKGEMGLGSGIVWDSIAKEEYDETKLKGKFLSSSTKPFKLIETMLVENKKIFLLKDHLKRLKLSAEYFLFKYDDKKITSQLKKIIANLDKNKYRLRITLNKAGILNHSLSQIVEKQNKIRLIVSDQKVNTKNRFQYFKTTNREIYDAEYKKYSKLGYFDVLFFNEKNELAEGSITNILIYKNKKIYTPPLSSGLLNGIYRSYLLQKNPKIIKRKLFLEDLINANKIVLTNSVRKEIMVDELVINNSHRVKYS
jgi:para-aminobenzoate synthetase / 4-amino-4-deoxychorismate lyase